MEKISEQIYHNTHRIYYHGSKNPEPVEELKLSTNFSSIPTLYITTSRWYANQYAGLKGRIYELQLFKEINIFNARSKLDLLKLRKKINLSEEQIYRLQHDDFLCWKDGYSNKNPGSHQIRDEILKAISSMKEYEGAFNYEQSEDINPSIILFSNNNIRILKSIPTWPIREMSEQEKNFRKYLLEYNKGNITWEELDEVHRI